MEPKTPQAIDACHDLITWLVVKLDAFPRSRRYTLGARIETEALGVLERLLLATYAPKAEKAAHLRDANVRLQILRHLWRVALEVKAVAPKAHRYAAERMVDIGQQIGLWTRSQTAPP
ncbi:four helix bundle protein [Polycyclovorans algicola]|uniref:four helix bundle protein n=1 Tax=Polycyclovorans algicola TaxID=616992 RepID=UPI001269479D|nr:four helix bundle protein [Polycyclovorans algicola]